MKVVAGVTLSCSTWSYTWPRETGSKTEGGKHHKRPRQENDFSPLQLPQLESPSKKMEKLGDEILGKVLPVALS